MNKSTARVIANTKLTEKKPCEECASQIRVQKHHSDYNKPLDVKYLCIKCHNNWHKKNKAINGNNEKTFIINFTGKEHIHKEMKEHCNKNGISMQKFIIEILQKFLKYKRLKNLETLIKKNL